MNDMNIEEKIVQEDFEIDDSSPFAMETELKNYPKIIEKYSRMHSQAVKEVDRITTELEVETAEIVDALCKLYYAEHNKHYPPTGTSEVRRTYVPLVRSWKIKKLELMDATEKMNILKGAVRALDAKGYRIAELFQVVKIRLYGDKSSVPFDKSTHIDRRTLEERQIDAENKIK